MQLLNRAPTRTYFILIFIIVSALFMMFSAVVYRHNADAHRLNDLTLYNHEVLRQSRRILMGVLDMESAVRGYLLSGKESFIEPYYSSREKLEEQIDNLLIYSEHDPATQENVKEWLQKIEEFSVVLHDQLVSFERSGVSSLSAAALSEQKRQMDELRVLIEGHIRKRVNDLQLRIKQSREAQENFNYVLMIGTLVAIITLFMGTLAILSLIKRSEKAEKEVRAVEDRFLMVMNSIDDGLYDTNFLDGSVYYTPSYKAMLGYTDEEHANTFEAFHQLLHPDDVASVYDVLQQYMEGKIASYKNVFRVRHKDGSWVWVLSRAVGIRDESGKMVRLIGTHTNITEHKNREEELRRITTEMETFTYITSHDLRAPLVNLKGFAGEMQYAIDKIKPVIDNVMPSLSEDERSIMKHTFERDIPESLRFIVQSVEKMDSLTTAVLDLSRIGKREYHCEPVDTQALIERCLDTLGYEITHKNIEITCGHLPIIHSDSLALEQVFTNILDNAVKYLDPTRPGKIAVSAKEMNNQIAFSIRDNGRGIAEVDRHKVFEIFRRARNTADIRGLGMGMTFVQATLRKIGGSIWFDSEPGIGTTFTIALPKQMKVKG